MKKIIGLSSVLAISLAVLGCDSTTSNRNGNSNMNLRGTSTNTGYVAPSNVAPGPTATSTPAMKTNTGNNMYGNANSSMNSNMADKPKSK
ncbi:MAG: hypothetical protein ABJA02_00890 [Acidobacteriota bacterium]